MKKILLGIILLSFAAPASALTLSDIETQSRRLGRDMGTNTSLYRYSDAMLDAWANEGQRIVQNRTWAVEKSTSFALSVGTTYYSLPTDCIAVSGVRFKTTANVVSKLTRTSEDQLYQNNPDFERQSARTPTEFFVRLSTQDANPLEIAFLPVVSTTTSTGTVHIDYVPVVTDMSSDSDEPFEGYDHLLPYHDLLVYWVVAKIKQVEGRSDEATFYLTLFENGIQVANDRLNRIPDFQLDFKGARGAGR